ncbi:hypothetical protein HN51_070008, partial [Arachis hypogaea]
NFIKLRGSVAQVFPPTIFFGGDLLHQRFSSIDEICCASVFYGIELCSAISPSPSSFIEHLEEIGGEAFPPLFYSSPLCYYKKLVLIKFIICYVIGIFEEFLSSQDSGAHQLSEKGVLQVLLDVKFATDILSGGDSNVIGELHRNAKAKVSVRRKQDQSSKTSAIREHSDQLLNRLSQRLDPIDWLMYQPYLWENERQSYLRHAVLFGFFVQLNRKYTDTVQKLPTNSKSNILRCSTVPISSTSPSEKVNAAIKFTSVELLLAVLHRVITECGTQDLDESMPLALSLASLLQELGSVCEERLLLVHERDLDNSNLSGHLGYCLGTGETVAIKKVLQDKNLKRFKISGKSKKVLWRLGIL